MHILIVGAGAVGQVYGHALAQAGHTVHFLVRPRYADAVREGFTLYPLHRRDGATPRHFADFHTLTTLDEVRAVPVEVLIPAVSGPALQQPWLPETLAAAPNASLVLLHAGMTGVVERLSSLAPDRPMAWGLIPFMAFAAPLPDQTLPEPGTGWWLPPFAKTGFDGDPSVVGPLTDALTRGGLPAAAQPGVAAQGAFGTALLSCHMAALQAGGWRFDGLRPLLPLAIAATREASALVAAETGFRPPAFLRLLHPWAIRAVLVAARWLVPFDAEAFFRVHFTKVNDQTQGHLDAWIAQGPAHGMPTPALTALAAKAWGSPAA